MSVCIALDDPALIGPDLRWPLRIAAQAAGDIHLIIPGADGSDELALDLTGAEAREAAASLAASLRAALDAALGEEGWSAAADRNAEAAPDPEGDARRVRARLVPPPRLVAASLEPLSSSADDLLVFAYREAQADDSDGEVRRRRFLSEASVQICRVRPGQRPDGGEILVATSRGPHARRAVRLAASLASRAARPLTGLYVEPDVGPDAARVGRRILDRLLDDALEQEAANVQRRVAIDAPSAQGVTKVASEPRYEVVVLGASRLGALGVRTSSVRTRLERASTEPTVITVRGALPIGSRLRRWLDGKLHGLVPQLARPDRVELVARVQSQSQWNFDYVLLMGLATLIASLGLLDDSPAVIIGAMLVAPLMTPLLGLGIALSQGNPALARMSIKAVALGFLVSFGLAYLVGILSPSFLQATAEMDARDWPQTLDLSVAFFSGLAAAYASGRPGLLAALPGVAIAAALVPPIATAGLALAIRDDDLTIGALLLFGVNMVSIVLAAAAALWAMGLRQIRKPSRLTRAAGAILTVVAVGMTIGLAISPPRVAPPAPLLVAIERVLEPELRLRHVRLKKEARGWVVQVDAGGGEPPSARVERELLEAARAHLRGDAAVRLTYRYELLIE